MSKAGDFQPDQNRLDEEWGKQADLAYRYGLAEADARADRDRAEAELDLVAAELDEKIRLHPGNFGIEKVTEAVVEKTIVRQPEYRRAVENRITCQHAFDVAAAARRAIDHKKAALENLVSLQGRDYFAEPVAPKEPSGDRLRQAKRDQAFGKSKGRRRDDA